MKYIFFALLTVFILTSCSHSQNAQKITDSSSPRPIESFDYSKNPVISENIQDQKLHDIENQIPSEINSSVEKWIRYFQGRGRPHMERYLSRSTRYEALMKKVLTENGLPTDLFYVALIESGFNAKAHSHASAVGYWQFIRGTGKRYNLKIDRMIDERRDPELATQAASEYFKDLFSQFNSWYLAMAAYNVGEGRIARVIKKYKTNDFWELAKTKKALPRETQEYVPKYLAAKLIAKNPQNYGFENVDYLPAISFDTMEFNDSINIRHVSEKIDYNYEDIKALNPKFKGEIAPAYRGKLNLRIPKGYQSAALEAARTSVASIEHFVPDKIEYDAYRIRRGDNLSLIARKYRTNIAYLKEINNLNSRTTLKMGQRIFVPDRTPIKVKTVSKKKSNYHIVKKGENLSTISKKYNLTVVKLKKKNKLTSKSVLIPGMKLKIASNL